MSHYHLIGIGGIGVGTLASLLLDKGETVSGSDLKAGMMTQNLSERGAKIFIGHAAANVAGADYVIYSSAVTAINPEMLEARNDLGSLYLLSRDPKKAREQAETVLAKDAKNSAAHLLLSNIYLTEKKLDEAIGESKKALEGEKKLDAYLHLANLYIIKKDLPQAEEMFKSAVTVDEKSMRSRFALAEFYLRSGKKDLAEREYIEATKIAPNDATAFMTLGNFYAAVGSDAHPER
jgi:Tfp pilus assembly protein PilF